jgi:hypothetical protein
MFDRHLCKEIDMSNVVDFDGRKVRAFLDRAIDGFLIDPPDTPYQRGWCSALVVLYKDALGDMNDARLAKCEEMVGPLPCRDE